MPPSHPATPGAATPTWQTLQSAQCTSSRPLTHKHPRPKPAWSHLAELCKELGGTPEVVCVSSHGLQGAGAAAEMGGGSGSSAGRPSALQREF